MAPTDPEEYSGLLFEPSWSLTITTPEHAQRMRETNTVPGTGVYKHNLVRTSIDSALELLNFFKKNLPFPPYEIFFTSDLKDKETDKDALPMPVSQIESTLWSLAWPLGAGGMTEVDPSNNYLPVRGNYAVAV